MSLFFSFLHQHLYAFAFAQSMGLFHPTNHFEAKS